MFGFVSIVFWIIAFLSITGQYLIDSEFGVCLHFESKETYFSVGYIPDYIKIVETKLTFSSYHLYLIVKIC